MGFQDCKASRPAKTKLEHPDHHLENHPYSKLGCNHSLSAHDVRCLCTPTAWINNGIEHNDNIAV